MEPWFYFADSAEFTELNRFEEIEYVQHQQHQQFIQWIHAISLSQPPLQQKQTQLTGKNTTQSHSPNYHYKRNRPNSQVKTPHNLTPPVTTTAETDPTHR